MGCNRNLDNPPNINEPKPRLDRVAPFLVDPPWWNSINRLKISVQKKITITVEPMQCCYYLKDNRILNVPNLRVTINNLMTGCVWSSKYKRYVARAIARQKTVVGKPIISLFQCQWIYIQYFVELAVWCSVYNVPCVVVTV